MTREEGGGEGRKFIAGLDKFEISQKYETTLVRKKFFPSLWKVTLFALHAIVPLKYWVGN